MSPFLIEILAGVVILLIAGIFLKLPSKKEEKKALLEQIVSLFVSGEKLTVHQISDRLRERTGGRRDLSDSFLYSLLDKLSNEKKLSRTRTPLSLADGSVVHKVEYSLPEEM